MKVPIFLHHHIANNNYSPYYFEQELIYLKKNGYKTLNLDELSDFLEGKRIYKKSLMITFDDGYADNYICSYPLLKKYGFNALVFLTTSYISDGEIRKNIFENAQVPYITKENERTKDGFLRWSEIKKMVDDGVFEVGSHTHTHKMFNKKSEYENFEEEIIKSNSLIKEKLNIDVKAFAWPWGKFDKEKLEIAKKYYNFIFTTITGSVSKNDSRFMLKRINILPHRNERWFKSRLIIHTTPIISDIYSKIYGIDRKINKFFKK